MEYHPRLPHRTRGNVILADKPGVCRESCADYVTLMNDDGTRRLTSIRSSRRSNQGTLLHKARRGEGQRFESVSPRRRPLHRTRRDGARQDLLVRSCRGGSTTRTIILSRASSGRRPELHPHRGALCRRRDTKLCPEENHGGHIPNFSYEVARRPRLARHYPYRAESVNGDSWSGKVTPRGETELTPRRSACLRASSVRGPRVRPSLMVPHGEEGKSHRRPVFTRDYGDDLPRPVSTSCVRVYVARAEDHRRATI